MDASVQLTFSLLILEPVPIEQCCPQIEWSSHLNFIQKLSHRGALVIFFSSRPYIHITTTASREMLESREQFSVNCPHAMLTHRLVLARHCSSPLFFTDIGFLPRRTSKKVFCACNVRVSCCFMGPSRLFALSSWIDTRQDYMCFVSLT